MPDWWIDDTEPYPGPGWDIQYIVDERTGLRYPDKSDLRQVTLGFESMLQRNAKEPKVGEMYVVDGVPVGVIMQIAYYRDPWKMVLEVQSYG